MRNKAPKPPKPIGYLVLRDDEIWTEDALALYASEEDAQEAIERALDVGDADDENFTIHPVYPSTCHAIKETKISWVSDK